MNTDAAHAHGPLGRRPRTLISAVVGGAAQLTVGFFTVTAIGLVSVPLWASVVLVSVWLAAAVMFVLTMRRNPVLALLVPVVNGLVLWGAIAAGEIWFGWTG